MTLNRKQIKEALEQTPIDQLLLGGNAKDISLTPKQKAFCEEIAKGSTKAKAYRTAYDSKAKPHTQSQEGQRLMKNPSITHHVEAIKLAIEAQKYLYPTHLRALVIQQLTEKALDPSVNHAQQIKALELIGKFSDVNLFQERKEIKTDTNTLDAKAKLLETLTNAISTSKNIDNDKRQRASDLLQEIANSMTDRPNTITIDQEPSQHDEPTIQETEPSIIDTETGHLPENDDPTMPDPPKKLENGAGPMHTIPDKQSSVLSTEEAPLQIEIKDGEGVYNFWEQFEEAPTETPPLSDLGSPTNPLDIPKTEWTEK
jgi:phage terminase small subunit